MVSWIKRQFDILYATYLRWERDDGPLMAAAVAYYVALSFFPLMLLLIAGVGICFQFTHFGQDAQQAILFSVETHLSSSARVQVEQALAQVQRRSTVHGPIALGMMLLSAIAGFVQLQRAFDRIGNVSPEIRKGILAGIRMVLIERWVAFLMLFALGLMIAAVFITGLVLSAIEAYSEKIVPGSGRLWGPVQIAASFFVNAALFSLIYHWLPKTPVPLLQSLRGGLLAAATWEIGRQVLAAILIGTKYTNAYGVVGSFIGVMLWCYYGVAVLLIGAEYIQAAIENASKNDQLDATAIPSSET